MTAYEIMLSESQERMLAIVRPEDADAALTICEKWGVIATVIGHVAPGENLRVVRNGEIVADVPAASLADEGPTYNRPAHRPAWIDAVRADDPARLEPPKDCGETLLHLLASPNICDKSWVHEQYDSVVQHNTLAGPGADAAIIRIEGTPRALSISTDGNGRYCQLDPRAGAMHAVAEAARNVACSGARPIAITNCLNFGNPEHPEVMWQFAESVAGIKEACLAFETPVTGGNVSFYNQTGDVQIHPTPVIGMVGILEDATKHVGIAWREGDDIVLLGDTRSEFGGSEWAWIAHGHLGGAPPEIDLAAEKSLQGLLAGLAEAGLVESAHDCAEGGLAVTLAESAIASGVGATVAFDDSLPGYVWMFSESGARAVVSTGAPSEVLAAAREKGVPARVVGRAGGGAVEVSGVLRLGVEECSAAFRSGFDALMSAPAV